MRMGRNRCESLWTRGLTRGYRNRRASCEPQQQRQTCASDLDLPSSQRSRSILSSSTSISMSIRGPRKGENYELSVDLNSEYREKRKDAIKRTIASMTVGKGEHISQPSSNTSQGTAKMSADSSPTCSKTCRPMTSNRKSLYISTL
jgi:hypothetical protein